MPDHRVAVVVVHGVADQKAGESIDAVAAMLASLPRAQDHVDPHYTRFSAVELQIPLRPVRLGAGPAARAQPGTGQEPAGTGRRVTTMFSERRDYLTRAAPASDVATRDRPGDEPVEPTGRLAHEFMRMQLEKYTGERFPRTYVTRCLHGVREGPQGKRVVHIYEMYWADLSRLGAGAFSFLSALYQLLMHLATLGRQAVDDAEHELSATRATGWNTVGRLQRYAVRVLTLPIPLLNLTLLVAGLCAFPAARLSRDGAAFVAIMALAAVGAALGYVLARKHVPGRPARWALVPFLSGGLGALLGVALLRTVAAPHTLVALAWWALMWLVIDAIAVRYDRFRPGARQVAIWVYATAVLIFVVSLTRAGTLGWTAGARTEVASLWTMELVFLLLNVSWIALYLCALLAAVLSRFAVRSIEDANAQGRARAAVRTGQLSLSLSTGAFLTITILIWCGLFAYGRSKLHVYECIAPSVAPLPGARFIPPPSQLAQWVPPQTETPEEIAARRQRCQNRPDARQPTPTDVAQATGATVAQAGGGAPATQDYMRGLLVLSVGSGVPVALLVAGAAILLLGWMAIPSLRAEQDAPTKCTNEESCNMGSWLSRGLDATSLVTWLLWLAVFLIPAAFSVSDFYRRSGWHASWQWLESTLVFLTNTTAVMLTMGGTALAASAVVVVTGVAKFGGSVLDLVLDVDNYLRTTPADGPPRARIAERYVSLLRYLASDAPEGGAYDSVVIIAHSLGALITVDLLRFLETEHADDDLARLGFGGPPQPKATKRPVHLFTMGGPIRQLINRFFPHRYRWVRDTPDNGIKPVAARSCASPPSAAAATPEPSRLGVQRWDNAYRSGDYVGRALWLEEWYARNMEGPARGQYPEPPTIIVNASTRDPAVLFGEMCIGVGGHTHYWDNSAPDIAERLDYLISTA